MRWLLFFFFWVPITLFAQESVEAKLVKSTDIQLQQIAGIDNFGIIYLIKDNVFHKIDQNSDVTYSNWQLGNITSANAFNPLKINLFYKNFNTVIILDNRLAEIFKIDFNTLQPYKYISHVSTGFDNTLWTFNIDLQQLELFDYKAGSVRVVTMPVQSNVLDIQSNINFCWLLTEKHLYKYNYFGSIISKIPNEGITEIAEDNGNLIVKKKGKLLYMPKDSEIFIPITINELLINQFLVTNETLYIYDSKTLHQYQLKIN